MVSLGLPIVFFSSCQKPSSLKKTHTTSSAEAYQERYLKLNFPEDPPTFDPRKGRDTISSTIHFMLFEGLTRFSEDASRTLGLADSIDISEDKLNYTFHIRDAKWTNGDTLTAYDFEFSWKSMLDPKFPCPNANLLYPILHAEAAKKGEISLDDVGIHALDASNFQVTLEKPTPYFLDLISFCVFSPVYQKFVSERPEWAEKASKYFVGNGPFRLTEWKHHNEITLEKNPLYWDADNIHLKGIQISILNDENTALQLFEKGKLDFIGSPYTSVPVDAAKKLKETNQLKARPVGSTMICAYNTRKKALSNKWIRKALSFAIDRTSIVANVGILDELAAQNAVPPVLKKGRDRHFIPDFDPVLARVYLQKGLEELSMTLSDLQNMSLIYTRRDNHHKISQAVQEMWMKHLGLAVTLEALDYKMFLTQVNGGNFDICQFGWMAQYNDQMNILDRFKVASNPKNYAQWEHADFAHLLNTSYFYQGHERDAILEKAEEILMEELPVAPIFHLNAIYIQQPNLKGVYTSDIGSLHFNNAYFDRCF